MCMFPSGDFILRDVINGVDAGLRWHVPQPNHPSKFKPLLLISLSVQTLLQSPKSTIDSLKWLSRQSPWLG
jgi:hypothetical protein